ncbi:AAA family ATPase [Methylocucumis oryzae]|uniref:Endonuclease GajA/Old nuclease/RecF-like AAA domain-containing protein n=1 Tax=Methylocucumis oryzae TaxID=1632867 RepID=A0A0F3II27_9GAMM|nr:AAA family ATPase [Methylocucumis oryzae]KJV06460.1 hypothetical protein VZ94_11020 [Methylocucumis oryzae]
MKLDVTVKNLGQIREATFQVRPVTVITGPNGTGKSFFTKALYSVLNVINKNVYHQSITGTIKQIQLQLDTLNESIKNDVDIEILESIKTDLKQLISEFESASSWKIQEYFSFASSRVSVIENMRNRFNGYIDSLKITFTKLEHVASTIDALNNNFDDFLFKLNNPIQHCVHIFSIQLSNELKDNFQISSLAELINYAEDKSKIHINQLLTIEINGVEKIGFEIAEDFIYEIDRFLSVVYFESPAYWRVRGALRLAKEHRPGLLESIYRFFAGKQENVLSGVPKYFYELDEALSAKTKLEPIFIEASQRLKDILGGEFVFKGSDLSFKNNTGNVISKNLVSLGMTNLGIIHALLRQNLITAGSFIFIDEPETNLHPDWQVKLVDVLLLLANAGVNVVMTTHSQDFAKALEVCIKKMQLSAEALDDFLSVHYLDHGGQLYPFESDNKLQQLIEARELLSMAYQELYFSDLH